MAEIVKFRKTLARSLTDTMNAANEIKNFLHMLEDKKAAPTAQTFSPLREKTKRYEAFYRETFIIWSRLKNNIEKMIEFRKQSGLKHNLLEQCLAEYWMIFRYFGQVHHHYSTMAPKNERTIIALLKQGRYNNAAEIFSTIALTLYRCVRIAGKIKRILLEDKAYLMDHCRKARNPPQCSIAIPQSEAQIRFAA